MSSPVTIKIPYDRSHTNDMSLAEKARDSFGPTSSDQPVSHGSHGDVPLFAGVATTVLTKEIDDSSFPAKERLLELYTHITKWREDSRKEYGAEMMYVEIQGVDGESALFVKIDLDWWQDHVVRFAHQERNDYSRATQHSWVVPKFAL